MLVFSTYRITGLHYTYGCATLSAPYVGYLYLENRGVILYLWVRHLKQSLCWLPLTFRITGFHFISGCPPLSGFFDCQVQLQNHWIKLDLWAPSFKFSLCLSPLRTEALSYTTLLGTPLQVRTLLVTSIFRITGLHHTYGCLTFRAAYVGQLNLKNHWGTLHLWVSNVKFSLLLLAPPIESQGCTTLMGAPPYVRLKLVTSSQRITRLQYSYGFATLSRAYVCYLYLQNHWV